MLLCKALLLASTTEPLLILVTPRNAPVLVVATDSAPPPAWVSVPNPLIICLPKLTGPERANFSSPPLFSTIELPWMALPSSTSSVPALMVVPPL